MYDSNRRVLYYFLIYYYIIITCIFPHPEQTDRPGPRQGAADAKSR